MISGALLHVMSLSEVQSLKASARIAVTVSGRTIFSSEVQPANIPVTIFWQVFGSVTSFSSVQPLNASLPISVTESGIVIDSSFSQLLNALSPIFVTVSGIVMVVKPGQLSNRLPGILVIPVSNSTLCSATHPLNGPPGYQVDEYAVSRLLGIRILVKLVQSEKTCNPNFVKLFDNCTVDSCLQAENAQSPISVTVSGIVTLTRHVPRNASSPIATTVWPSIVCGIASADTLPL